LGFQLKLAATKGYGGRLQANGERLCSEMAALFDSYLPQPSLLHGDLWAGNAGADKQGYPVIFDPACYYGDREADLAMTSCLEALVRIFMRLIRLPGHWIMAMALERRFTICIMFLTT